MTAQEFEQYRFDKMSSTARIVLHSRIIKRACNWGWFPNEWLQKRPFLHAYCLADIVLAQLDSVSAQPDKDMRSIEPLWLRGLDRLLEIILDTRHGYLTQALGKLLVQTGKDYSEAFRELERSRQWRDQAQRSISVALEHARRLNEGSAKDPVVELKSLLCSFRDYCRAVFLSLDHLQRTWVKAENTETVLTTMYEYLYELYPPKFPSILLSTSANEQGDTNLH